MNFYPFNYKGLLLRDKNKAVIRTDLGHLCGYVAIPKLKIPKSWYGSYDADALQYLNIHGGITYCEKQFRHVVFGFDCAHAGDDGNPRLRDQEHVMNLTRQMEQQLLDYGTVIFEWRKSGKAKRCRMLDKIYDAGKLKSARGFGAMIDMLGGSESITKKY